MGDLDLTQATEMPPTATKSTRKIVVLMVVTALNAMIVDVSMISDEKSGNTINISDFR